MGREDSHYRPDGSPAPETVGSGNWPPNPTELTSRPEAGPQAWTPAPPGGQVPPSGASVPARPYDPAGHPAAAPQPYETAQPQPAHQPYGNPWTPPVPPTGTAPAAVPEESHQPPRSRRGRVLAGLAAVLVLLGAAGGVVVFRPGPVDNWLGGHARGPATQGSPEPSPSPVLLAASTSAPLPSGAALKALLDPLLTAPALGPRVNVSVLDVTTGESLYGHNPELETVPASVTKLVTGVAALAARGPGYRIATRVVAGNAPGEVVLVGGGDATLSVNAKGTYPGTARLDLLAKQVRNALGGTPVTRVTVDSTLFSGPKFGPGWDADIPTGGYGASITALMTDGGRIDPKVDPHLGAPRHANPDLAAGQAFARLLGLSDQQAQVRRGTAPAPAQQNAAAPSPGAAPAPGAELGRVESLPMVRMVDLMISNSDNIIAETLARQVALARNQPVSFAGGAAATDAVIAELGLPADQLTLADGSGLSRTNRISPSLLTHLLVLAGNGRHPELAGIFSGLPVGGWSGTLVERYGAKSGTGAGAGVVRAKTGTLTGVHAISGLVTTADGRLLAFAFLTDRTPPELFDGSRVALDKIAAALAGCGCR